MRGTTYSHCWQKYLGVNSSSASSHYLSETQNLCLREFLLENRSSSACFACLSGWVAFYSPASWARDFDSDELRRVSDYFLNICEQKEDFSRKDFLFSQGPAEGCCAQERVERMEVLRVTWPCRHPPLQRRHSQARLSCMHHCSQPSQCRAWLTLLAGQALPSLKLGPPLRVRVPRLVFWICLPEYHRTNVFLGLPLYLSPMLKEGEWFLALVSLVFPLFIGFILVLGDLLQYDNAKERQLCFCYEITNLVRL